LSTFLVYPHATSSTLHSSPTRRSSDLLERDVAPHLTVVRAIDDAHAALAEPVAELKALEAAGKRGVHFSGSRRGALPPVRTGGRDRKSTRLNSSHQIISYAVFCFEKKK